MVERAEGYVCITAGSAVFNTAPGVAYCGCTRVAVQLALQQPASWERRHFSVYPSENVDCGLCPETTVTSWGSLDKGENCPHKCGPGGWEVSVGHCMACRVHSEFRDGIVPIFNLFILRIS